PLALRPLTLGLLGAAALCEGLGGLAALLRLAGDHLLHLVVGELTLLLARDLFLGDRGERQPERGGAQLVAPPDRGVEVFLQLRLERGHDSILAGAEARPLPDFPTPPFPPADVARTARAVPNHEPRSTRTITPIRSNGVCGSAT